MATITDVQDTLNSGHYLRITEDIPRYEPGGPATVRILRYAFTGYPALEGEVHYSSLNGRVTKAIHDGRPIPGPNLGRQVIELLTPLAMTPAGLPIRPGTEVYLHGVEPIIGTVVGTLPTRGEYLVSTWDRPRVPAAPRAVMLLTEDSPAGCVPYGRRLAVYSPVPGSITIVRAAMRRWEHLAGPYPAGLLLAMQSSSPGRETPEMVAALDSAVRGFQATWRVGSHLILSMVGQQWRCTCGATGAGERSFPRHRRDCGLPQ